MRDQRLHMPAAVLGVALGLGFPLPAAASAATGRAVVATGDPQAPRVASPSDVAASQKKNPATPERYQEQNKAARADAQARVQRAARRVAAYAATIK